MRVALASCVKLPEPDDDEALVLAALRGAGVDAQVLAWDDESAAFGDQDLVVLRSTWNYYERVEDFLAWARKTAATTRLLNPASIVAWNAKKTYLTELDAQGTPSVPTELVTRGAARRAVDILDERGWDEVVIKPVVSAGSFRTERFARARLAAAQSFLDDLVSDRDAIVQRWMPSVETYGERSLVWIDGAITHAIRKSPRFSGGAEQVSGEVPVAPDERAFAERAIAPWSADLLYARIDMVRDDVGALRLMELELIEPSLFFHQSAAALDRFVAAVVRRTRSQSHSR